jgi:hypothetical protein
VIIPKIDSSDIKDKEKLKQVLLGSTVLTPKIWHKTSVSTAENIDNFNYGDHNSLNYAQIIKPLFDSSIVSIIVETVGHERATTFTEKSLMPVLSINFPLWFGGYQQAEFFKDLGFDVFDDVTTSYRLKENFDGSYNTQGVMRETREGIFIRHVKMPDGTVYEISGLKAIKALKAMRKYMFECEQYEKEYNSNPKYQSCTFEEAVSDYNKMCP